MLVATADHAGTQPQQDPPGHFHELMESPCTNHAYAVKHHYKDYELLKHLLRQTGGPKEEKRQRSSSQERGRSGQGYRRLKLEVI